MLAAAAWLGGTGAAQAHGGGTPQLTGADAGPYRLYAWTTPEPLRAGEIHVTVGVTQPDAQGIERPVTDAEITVTFVPEENAGATGAEVVLRPEIASATGGVYYEADTGAPLEGAYRVQVAAEGPGGSGAAEFSAVVLPAGRSAWGWVTPVAAAIAIALAAAAVWVGARKARRPTQADARARVNRKSV
jgi:hypothetical protein